MRKVSEMFGELTFNKSVMREKLNKVVFEKIVKIIENGEPLENSISNDIAHAMKDWALENGATHYTHWFQPQRGGTAEKHESFIEYDEYGGLIERFRGESLIQSEPDASSFPSGGIRSTFEARGYTAWDPTSSAFLINSGKRKTLVIPSVFFSWTGHVMDLKTPMLRSQKVLSEKVIRIQKLLGNRYAKRVKVYIGAEQEYFLIDKRLFNRRNDLQICNRTIFGNPPAKGQQMEDHYFGSIKDRVLTFMEDFDLELYRRGIPSKTRHNEVAPNQFEIAPLYEESNIAVDHNLQMMDIIKRIADKNGLRALLHEKPFAGVNGSGKHVNWSIGDNTGANYLSPSRSPIKNITFLVTVGALLLGLEKYGDLLRASIATAENDHRLGGHEAPPAIMSVYLGSYLSDLLDDIEKMGRITNASMGKINLGVQNLPKVSKDISDRNRTSPLAFTGDKFEFRAVGSSQNTSESITILNLLVIYGYDYFYDKLSNMKGDNKENAIIVLRDVLKKTKRIRFEGNGYSKEWFKESKKRGLANIDNTPNALKAYLKKDVIELFSNNNILSKIELESKVAIKLTTYIKLIDIEIKTAINIAKTLIVPAILQHINNLSITYNSLESLDIMSENLKKEVCNLHEIYNKIYTQINTLKRGLTKKEQIQSLSERAELCANSSLVNLKNLRKYVDKAETLVANDLWPIAKYQEILNSL
ncbi:MAG: glutamine synthetase III [Candidatus Cloacimonadota bacterium]|nr:glutamine synthetase III [Candidatus Cloacimonadota bacterium]